MFNANLNSIFISAYSLPILSFSRRPSTAKESTTTTSRRGKRRALRQSESASRTRPPGPSTACRRRCGTCVINEKVNTVF